MSFTTFIQWKGTDLCMDFNCPECGGHSHFDGMFAYSIQCPHCETYYKMPSEIGPLVEKLPGKGGMVLLSAEHEEIMEEKAKALVKADGRKG